jgi:predicted transcriptional regulator
MSNRQIVMELLQKLPEDAPLEEIAREVEFLAGIQVARAQARRGEGKDLEEVVKQVDEWLAE